MIEHGVDIKSQLRFGASRTDSAMAQLFSITAIQGIKKVHQLTDILRSAKPHFFCF